MEKSEKEHEEIKHIRQELREMKISERKFSRENFFEKTRFALGECTLGSNLTPDEVSNMAKELKRKSLNLNKYRDLQNALLQSEQNINAFLAVDNVVHSLVRDLSGNNPQLQLISVSCCCNIALGNSKACMTIAKNCTPYLLTEFDSMSYHLVEICVWTIGNLVTGNQKVFELLIAQDCMKHLIKLINHSSETVRSAVIYSLNRCLFVGHRLIPESEKVDLAREIKNSSPSFKNSEDFWLLALLSSEPKCSEFLTHYVPNALQYLDNKLSDTNNISEISALIRLLGNLVCEPSGQVAELLLNNTSFTIESLLMHTYVHVRKETLWLLGNIYNHSKNEIREKMRTNLAHWARLTEN